MKKGGLFGDETHQKPHKDATVGSKDEKSADEAVASEDESNKQSADELARALMSGPR